MKTDLQNKKLSIIQAVLSLDDEIILDDVLNRLQKPFPCQFTTEEKWAILEQARKDEASGNHIPQDQVMDRYKSRFS